MAYKIAKLTTEGLILNGILITAGSQYSHFRTPKSNNKQEIFWCFQGV